MVNTFVPYSDMRRCVQVLDHKRLGKQRVEASQILQVLEGKSTGWANHPATQMWAGYEDALRHYLNLCIDEWVRRGYKNTMEKREVPERFEYPWWWGDEQMHRAHRSSLLEKAPEHYGEHFDKTLDQAPDGYLWPNTQLRKLETLSERRKRRGAERRASAKRVC